MQDKQLTEARESYRQIFKATSLFGGVQAFSIVISVIRSKFIAVLLGPAGMGIVGLLTSTTGLVASFTNFGLRTAAVKDVAAAAASGKDADVSKVVTVLRRLVWITGLLGMLLTIALSPWLSQITFGNNKYTFAFIWISATLLFDQLSSGQMVLLQGLQKLQYLARANVIGLVIGLLISVPVYYLLHINGIVPVILITSLSNMGLSWYFARKISIIPVTITNYETRAMGKAMFKLGFVLSLNSIIVSFVSYLVRIYISKNGGVDQVGFYNSGFSIINMYVGMIFAAMGTDYYPRLSALANDNLRSRELINQQAEVAILILAPILTVFLVFIHWIVILLYSSKFVVITGMIHWAALGMYFKAASWAVAFILLAKGASKLFFWNEVVANLYTLVFNIVGYKIAGLNGLGISFMAAYIVYFVQVYFLTRIKYSFCFNRLFYLVAGFQFTLGLLCFILVKSLSSPWTYILGSILIIVSVYYSFKKLEERIGIKDLFLKKLLDIKMRNL